MPRENSGYDPVPVCAFCIDNLTSGSTPSGLRANLISCAATAGSKSYLKSLSLGKLKKYADAYNLRSDQIIEKDDLVDRLVSYRVSRDIRIKTLLLIDTTCRDGTDAYHKRMRYVMRHLHRLIVHTKPSWAGFLQEVFGPKFDHPS